MFDSELPVRITCILMKCGWLLCAARDDAKAFDLMQRLFTHLRLDQQIMDRRWLEVYELAARNLVLYGKIREAVSLLEQVVTIREQTLAEDHPDRLASQHELARAYQANGQVKEAISLLEQVVTIKEQTLAEDHPHRLASQQVLATMYWDVGRRNTALEMTEHIVEIRQQVLDRHHPARKRSEACLERFKGEMGIMQPA